MSKQQVQQARQEAEQSVTAWLLTLEIARNRGDFERAAMAKQQLALLGVQVNYSAPVERREVANA